ncbi:hypothetical protein DB88DRAFT_478221 [Papiliotrema laurentii]|uniref:Peptide hydrolase n=1 Tax=Papiliotrema laurentii TaxID=5418 RepID=A0AAD9FWD9_PAPLA|nr:hypothetical protein DB88DRAFT_478221 [Papiliotrema laurentii]
MRFLSLYLLVPALRTALGSVQPREIRSLSEEHLRMVATADPPEWQSVTEGHLGKMLIPRASGSQNNTLVQEYISSVFNQLGWHAESTRFTEDTPIGSVEFTNLIFTFDPGAARKIILSAHFDSKWFPDYPANTFIGATDSAAPCAMLMDLAESLTPLLAARKERVDGGRAILRPGFDEEEAAETTLQIVFFDGEEAFHDWTDTDSIYGARHLAELWEDTFLPPQHPLMARRMGPNPTVLNTIDTLVLLDLLGSKSPRIYSYFRETDWLHGAMSSADERLRKAQLVQVERGEDGWFPMARMNKGMIGDDHVPFLQRGVNILHVISNPFPRVWHTLGDDATALSMPAMRRWNRILRVFTAEYLGLAPETPPANRALNELTPQR